MSSVKESEGDQAGSYSPPSGDVVQGSVPSYTVKLSEVAEAGPYYPSDDIVQGSGSSYCPSNDNIGTLGVRVITSPNTGFFYVATYHNFAEDKTDFAWMYSSGGDGVPGQRGTVIKRNYTWGLDKNFPLLDCALIQLSTQSQSSIRAGLYRGADTSSLAVRGTKSATRGMIVSKFGITTGLTYGRVIDLPPDIDKSYANHLFAVELCDVHGSPTPGNFAGPGDSGAPVVDEFGYVLGLVVQVLGPEGSLLGLINRIEQIEAALAVTVHAG